MSMKSINFNTGFKSYIVNKDKTNVIKINVSDPNLLARIENVDKEIQPLFERLDKTEDLSPSDLADIDRQIKELIDKTFNADVSAHAFGETSCYAPLENGKILAEEFFDAFIPIVAEDAQKAQEKYAENSKKKAQKYIKEVESMEAGEGSE